MGIHNRVRTAFDRSANDTAIDVQQGSLLSELLRAGDDLVDEPVVARRPRRVQRAPEPDRAAGQEQPAADSKIEAIEHRTTSISRTAASP
jgi:hypothetical protein